MLRFLAHRLLLGLVVLWIVSVAVFVLFFVTPHDPARLIAGRLATPQTVALVNHRLGLDRPLPDQYGGFVWRALHGDLGYSYYSSAPVRQLVASRLPVTVSLVLGARCCGWCSGSGWGWPPPAGHAASPTGSGRCSCSPGCRCRRSWSACC